jgi:hypothetical protein
MKKVLLMKNALRASSLTLLLVSLTACGGGSGSANPLPNTGNIPNLAVRPSAQASALKKIRLTGTVFNSLTGDPIERAEVSIQVLSTAAVPSVPPVPPSSGGPAPIPTPPPSAPVTPGASTPFPAPSVPVGSTPMPAPTPVPGGLPTLAPPQ